MLHDACHELFLKPRTLTLLLVTSGAGKDAESLCHSVRTCWHGHRPCYFEPAPAIIESPAPNPLPITAPTTADPAAVPTLNPTVASPTSSIASPTTSEPSSSPTVPPILSPTTSLPTTEGQPLPDVAVTATFDADFTTTSDEDKQGIIDTVNTKLKAEYGTEDVVTSLSEGSIVATSVVGTPTVADVAITAIEVTVSGQTLSGNATACPEIFEPVCANYSDIRGERNFSSACHARSNASASRIVIDTITNGECVDPVCPADGVVCGLHCPHGFVLDTDDCPTCACKDCPDIVCGFHCEHGYLYTYTWGDGCPRCQCADAPTSSSSPATSVPTTSAQPSLSPTF